MALGATRAVRARALWCAPWARLARAMSTSRPCREAWEAVQLRPYQKECIENCLDALQRGCTRLGVSSPTGSGKTTMFVSLIERIKAQRPATQALILVNAIELARQAADRARHMLPHWRVEIDQGAKWHASGLADITVATVQTLRRPGRLDKYDPARFKCVIVDEAHHATSASYLSVLSHFNKGITPVGADAADQEGDALLDAQSPTDTAALAARPMTPVFGFSATFARHDGMALGHVFEEIVFHRDFLDMIEEKWCAAPLTQALPCPIHLAAHRHGPRAGHHDQVGLCNRVPGRRGEPPRHH